MVSNKPTIVLSSDTLPGYWLDYIFDTAQAHGFDGIDLAMRKNFDAWNSKYVKKLIKKYELPVKIIQTSSELSAKEIEQALILAQEVGAKIITFNAPTYFNIKSFRLIIDGIPDWKKQFPDLDFAIITPDSSSMTLLPVLPKYRFSSIVEIIKKFGANVGLDVSAVSEEAWETIILRKLENIKQYLSVIYTSDKSATGKWHLPLWEGTLGVNTLISQLAKNNYQWVFSIKLSIAKKDLADADKVSIYLRKSITYIKEYFTQE